MSELNPKLKDTQFADYHGHGWNFRAVFKRDRKGNLLDADGKHRQPTTIRRSSRRPCTWPSIHVDMGMQCVDCHFAQDNHGNGYIYGEVASAVEIDCKDCHGTVDALSEPAHLRPGRAGPAARPVAAAQPGRPAALRVASAASSIQRSMVDPKLEWQVAPGEGHASIRPARDYNAKAARAKLMSTRHHDAGSGARTSRRATSRTATTNMECYTCHTSWTTSCARLPSADRGELEDRAPSLRRRRDAQLRHLQPAGRARRHVPARPARPDEGRQDRAGALDLGAGAVLDQHQPRAHLHPAAADRGERLQLQAFAPHYPHTERKTETKTCSDCHLSEDERQQRDHGAAAAAGNELRQLRRLQRLGRRASGGIEAVQVTEWDEPQAVIGSYLHRYAYPDWYRATHEKRGTRARRTAHEHAAAGAARCLQLRGEYLYVAEGASGMRVYDVASIAQQGRLAAIITAPFSPLGHDTHIASKNATCVALPTNQPIAPAAQHGRPDAR